MNVYIILVLKHVFVDNLSVLAPCLPPFTKYRKYGCFFKVLSPNCRANYMHRLNAAQVKMGGQRSLTVLNYVRKSLTVMWYCLHISGQAWKEMKKSLKSEHTKTDTQCFHRHTQRLV